MSQRYSINSEMRGEVEIYKLNQYGEEIAYASVVPGWGNNCFDFYVQE